MINETKLYYDITAEQTAEEWYGSEVLLPSIQEFAALLPPNARVLDMGCGPGHGSIKLAEAGLQVVGVDFSEECIRVARERCPVCRFEVQDFLELGTGLGRFQGVFFSGSLPYIKPVELQSVMKSISRVLEDNGYLSIITIEGDKNGSEMRRQVVGGIILNSTIFLYTKKKLIWEAGKAGFEYVREGALDAGLKDKGCRHYLFKAGISV